MKMMCRSRRLAVRRGLLIALAAVAAGLGSAGAAAAQAPRVTFAKDVAPIFQRSCQVCHRPGTAAPMSLVEYRDARPWARAIRQRVAQREMPPWHIDRTVGVQRYKNDRSLTDQEIRTIVDWVDAGAPLGDPADLPPPVQFRDDDEWAIGEPDLVVSSPEIVMYAEGPDWWPGFVVETGLAEDRYVKAVETKPSRTGRFFTHHANTAVIQAPDPFLSDELVNGRPQGELVSTPLSEYVMGKAGDIFPAGSGRLLKAGSRVRFNMHYYPIGEEARDSTSVGFVFYPRGETPRYVSRWLTIYDNKDIDIPPHSVSRSDAYFRLDRPTRLDGFQPHMHMRGKAMCLEAIYPNVVVPRVNTRGVMEREMVACVDRFDFNWQMAYMFEDDAAPLLPAGTILHTISVHDNTAGNRLNPDPSKWVGYGQRSTDEMANAHLTAVFLGDEDYERLVAERRARQQTGW